MDGTLLRMRLALTPQVVSGPWRCRNVTDRDVPSLAALMDASLKGAVDRHGKTIADALARVQGIFDGEGGRLMRPCSYVVEEDGRLLSASIVAWSDAIGSPLLAVSMTHPDHKDQGMATLLLRRSINALIARGSKRMFLVIDESNLAARHLYDKVGFQRLR